MSYDLIFSDEVKNLLDNYDDEIYAPKYDNLFLALDLCPLDICNVVILGQDPYPKEGDAMGLSFSVNRSDKLPASLKNIYKELESDLGIKRSSGDLTNIAKQGVLFLNTILSIETGITNSHSKLGWQKTTDSIISQISNKGNVIFVLLGAQAHKYEKMIDVNNNYIIKQVHPSPLSAYRGFFGSKIFSEINEILENENKPVIDWSK